eukprot:gene12997-13099_t
MSDIKRVVLAYSGGLDTSVILKWLQVTYNCEVVTFTADLGQGEELEPARAKAQLMGIKPEHIYIDDLREEFVRDFVFPMMRANARYEGDYLLGTSIARPLISKRLIEIARETGADAVAHGATGKGNDQVRFELSAYALDPGIKVIAPWREWDLTSRTALIAWAEAHQVPVPRDKRGESPFSTDANLLHTSSEGKVLEDPWAEVPDYVFSRTVNPEDAPDQPEYITVDFQHGDGVAINGEAMSPATLLTALNEYGRKHGIGRLDLVENRFVGMKSRGMYETPGGTIYAVAHRGIESITLDRGAAHLKDELMPKYAELIYNGFWFAPEREMLQAAIDHSQAKVNGTVRLKLYKGQASVVGRQSPDSLYSERHVTFEDDAGAYDQKDAAGFIKLNALRLRLLAQRDRFVGHPSPDGRRLKGIAISAPARVPGTAFQIPAQLLVIGSTKTRQATRQTPDCKADFLISHRLTGLCRQTDLTVRILGCVPSSEGARQSDDREDITRMTLAGLPAAPGPERVIFPEAEIVKPAGRQTGDIRAFPGRDDRPAGAPLQTGCAPNRERRQPERADSAQGRRGKPCASRRAPGASTGTGPHRSHPAGASGRPGGKRTAKPAAARTGLRHARPRANAKSKADDRHPARMPGSKGE